ncbi:MAG: DUF4163 domain-containing protein [Oscillospiraceae bacterium]|jgi:hypothetical protein|nr:DUF4163 domain-containing protein [Oscillospiraceae bacterium]
MKKLIPLLVIVLLASASLSACGKKPSAVSPAPGPSAGVAAESTPPAPPSSPDASTEPGAPSAEPSAPGADASRVIGSADDLTIADDSFRELAPLTFTATVTDAYGLVLADFDYFYPQIELTGNAAATAKINAQLSEHYNSEVRRLNGRIAEINENPDWYSTYYSDFPGAETGWFQNSYRIVSAPGGRLSVVFSETYYYPGAAHDGSDYRAFVFDTDTGARIGLGDAFTGSRDDFVGALCREAYAAVKSYDYGLDYHLVYGIPEDSAETELAFVTENFGQHIDDSSFALGAEGVVLVFNTYDISSLMRGPTWVLIPYAALSGDLRAAP